MTQIQKIEKAHAKYSASGSHRWLTCHGSIKLSEKAPPSRDSVWSKEGTTAHSFLEATLKAYISGGKPYAVITALSKSFGAEMAQHVLNAFEWIKNQVPEGATVIAESRVDATAFTKPGQFGTLDCAIIEYYGQLTVIDFKYGAGIAVSPEENPQLIYYALGILEKYGWDFESVRMVVIQPRALGEAPVKEWTTSVDNMVRWKVKFLEGVKNCEKPNAPLTAFDPTIHGEENHCRFCPAAVICPALREQSIAEVKGDFDDETGTIVLPAQKPVKVVAVKNLGRILTACTRLEIWIDALREHALHALETGTPVEGYKLVAKRSIRRWVNREQAKKKALGLFGTAVLSDPELLSPAQLEQVFDEKVPALAKKLEKFFETHVTSESSGTTIAPVTDKRPAYNLFDDEFKNESQPKTGKEEPMAPKKAATKKVTKKAAKKTAKKSK